MARINEEKYPILKANELVNPVLFVVDMVNGFVKEGALADPAIGACSQPIARLIEALHSRVIFVNDTHEEDAAEFQSFPVHCLRGSREAQVVDELLPYADEVLEKNCISAAAAPGFAKILESLPDKCDLIVTGCCTDLCVLQLALPLKSWISQNNRKGCRVIVPINCVETYEIPDVHDAKFWNEAALANMAANGIRVVSKIVLDARESHG